MTKTTHTNDKTEPVPKTDPTPAHDSPKLTKEIIEAVLKDVKDPELGLDVYTLALIYKYDADKDNKVSITMTFTSPFCPYGPQLMEEIEEKLKEKGATEVEIEITFDPPWKPPENLRAMLGLGEEDDSEFKVF